MVLGQGRAGSRGHSLGCCMAPKRRRLSVFTSLQSNHIEGEAKGDHGSAFGARERKGGTGRDCLQIRGVSEETLSSIHHGITGSVPSRHVTGYLALHWHAFTPVRAMEIPRLATGGSLVAQY
jgi:hypothetical protein